MDLLNSPVERCKKIMEEIAPHSVIHRRAGDCIKLSDGPVRLIYLWHKPERRAVELAMMPGDTINQARQLYGGLNRDRVLALRDEGWAIRSNLHFSHFDTGYHWSKTDIELGKYLDYWQGNQLKIGRIKKEQNTLFNLYFDELQKLNLISLADREELDRLFNRTKRSTVNPCPGIHLYYGWPLEQAAQLDNRGSFVSGVRDKIKQAFSTWNQNFVLGNKA